MSNQPPYPPHAGPTDYNPLPLHQNDHLSNQLYNVPQHSTDNLYNGSHQGSPAAPYQDLPPGASQPRFQGQALYNSGNRDSYASGGAGSEFGSVYALNDTADSRGTYRDDPSAVAMEPMGGNRYLEEKNQLYAAPREKSKKSFRLLGIIIGLILLIAAVMVPVYFTVIKKHDNNDSADNSKSDGSSSTTTAAGSKPSGTKNAIVTGGDGSKVTMDDGTTFTYSNKFGGTWYYDPQDPFNNGAKAQTFSPGLNETFKLGVDKIRGVNLGGWLVTEPFISPALYEQYLTAPTPAVDEWTLSQNMAADKANGGLGQLENHYKTFITEKDFAEIAGAGLNYVRIPIAYWAIEVRDGEPFLPKVSWQYFLKAIKWARKYGLRINLDLHSLPGSQNGWNHSGRLGTVGMLNGPMGLANAQRSLDYIRIIAEFISQPQYKDVVTMFGITNEPQGSVVGQDQLSRYYLEAYNIVRKASGTGEGKGPIVSFHDAFFSRDKWAGFLPNADRVALDSHPYIAFGSQSGADISTFGQTPCTAWGPSVSASMDGFGMSVAGEWSNAVNDCGLYVNNVGEGTRFEGTYKGGTFPRVGSCDKYTNYKAFDQPMKDGLKQFSMASMDALQNWFFWTWKIGPSSASGNVESPGWSYQLGLENGWMPTDPRQADGACTGNTPWSGTLKAWQTGGAGAGSIPASVTDEFSWPPPVISAGGAVARLPTYTPTGPVPTLAVPTDAASSGGKKIDVGSGWANKADNAGLMVEVAGCKYLDPWVDPGTAPPAVCAAKKKRMEKRAPAPVPGPGPSQN